MATYQSLSTRFTAKFAPQHSNEPSKRSRCIPPTLSISISSFFGRLSTIVFEPDHALLAGKDDDGSRDLEKSDAKKSPSECASTFESAKKDVDEIKPISGPWKAVIAAAPCRPSRVVHARMTGSKSSISSRSTRRPEPRDFEHLAELPALPPNLRSIRVKHPTVSEHNGAQGVAERRDPVRPRVPDNPQKVEAMDPNLVSWGGPQDPENALNESSGRKWISTLALAYVTFCVNFATSCLTPATKTAATDYGVASEVSGRTRTYSQC